MSIVHLKMEALALERIRAREDDLKCVEEAVAADVAVALMEVDVEVDVAVALMEAEVDVEEASGCLFVATEMSNATREAVIVVVVVDEARSMLNVLHAPIGPLRMPKLLHLHLRLRLRLRLRLPHMYPQKRKSVVMFLRPLELLRRRRLVKLNPRFK
jgi:hypothetical protein